MGKSKPDPVRIRLLKAVALLNFWHWGPLCCPILSPCQDFYEQILQQKCKDGMSWKQLRTEELLARSQVSKERIERALQQGIVTLACFMIYTRTYGNRAVPAVPINFTFVNIFRGVVSVKEVAWLLF